MTVAIGVAVVVATGSWTRATRRSATSFNLVWIPIWIAWLLIYYPLTMRRAGAHNGQTWGKQVARHPRRAQDGRAFDAPAAIVREVVSRPAVRDARRVRAA